MCEFDRGSRELRIEWEKRLADFSLDDKSLRTQDRQTINHPATDETFPFQHDPDLTGIPWRRAGREMRTLDWCDWQTMHRVPRTVTARRESVEWAMSPEKTRALLEWIYPKWQSHPAQRRNAECDAALIHLSLRMFLSHSEVSEILDCSKARIGVQLARLEKLAEQFFSYPAGSAPLYRTGQGGQKTFSHEEALRLREEGLGYEEIGTRLGVSKHAVAQAVRKMKKEAA